MRLPTRHLLLITPNHFMFTQLLLKARQRSYTVLTNGDQGVIEQIFDVNHSAPSPHCFQLAPPPALPPRNLKEQLTTPCVAYGG